MVHKSFMDDFDFENGKVPKRGRPATGVGLRPGRLPVELSKRVENFAAENFMDFSDAVRELVTRGLDK